MSLRDTEEDMMTSFTYNPAYQLMPNTALNYEPKHIHSPCSDYIRVSHPWNDPLLFGIQRSPSHHSVRLARTSLPVRKNAHIIAVGGGGRGHENTGIMLLMLLFLPLKRLLQHCFADVIVDGLLVGVTGIRGLHLV